jgi:hypothetical protein
MAPHLAPRAPKTPPRRSCAPRLTCGNVRPLGFEPRTCGLRVRCSAIELEALRGGGGGGGGGGPLTEGTRTPDLQGHNLAL